MNDPWDVPALPDVAERIWAGLAEAVNPGAHPWRTPVLSTLGPKGPSVRTVVLRGFTRPGFELIAFSDARAAKVEELLRGPESTWLFYNPAEHVQVRAHAKVRLHIHDSVAQTYWHRLPDEQRGRYQSTQVPGTPIPRPGGPVPPGEGDVRHFAVLIAHLQDLDWLWLGPGFHRRAQFQRNDGWQGHWVEP